MSPEAPLEANPRPARPSGAGAFTWVRTLSAGPVFTLEQAVRPNGSVVVLRKLDARLANDADARTLLNREAELAMRVHSPHLVRVLGTVPGAAATNVLEHLDGCDLGTLLSSVPWSSASPRVLLPALVQALRGLSALHTLRDASGAADPVIHQAPSPRHIFVDTKGVAKLLDLTQTMGARYPWSPRFEERLVPEYMAPEQALSPAHADPSCDLFIAGLTLWTILTGRTLFAADGRDEALQRMLRGHILAPSEAGAQCGAELDRLCLRTLQRARHDRPSSAHELAEELVEVAERAGLFAPVDELAAFVTDVRHRLDAPSPARVDRTLPLALYVAGASEASGSSHEANTAYKAGRTLIGFAVPTDGFQVAPRAAPAAGGLVASAMRTLHGLTRPNVPLAQPEPVHAPALAAPPPATTPPAFAPDPWAERWTQREAAALTYPPARRWWGMRGAVIIAGLGLAAVLSAPATLRTRAAEHLREAIGAVPPVGAARDSVPTRGDDAQQDELVLPGATPAELPALGLDHAGSTAALPALPPEPSVEPLAPSAARASRAPRPRARGAAPRAAAAPRVTPRDAQTEPPPTEAKQVWVEPPPARSMDEAPAPNNPY